jgi:hypothetical protein
MKIPAPLCWCLLALVTTAPAQTTINSTSKYTYGANTGWLNWCPSAPDGVVVGEAFLTGQIYAANFGWISVGDGTPADGHTYANTSAADIGVNHNGTGTLSGYAYGANIGWVNFGWAAANDPNRPHFDLLTGQFTGYAYSANTGWINLAGNLTTDTLACPDSDNDGMADAWEIQKFGGITAAGLGTDKDKDGQSDAAEYAADTNPNDAAEYLKITSVSRNAGTMEMTLQFVTSRPTRRYRIQTSTTLLNAGPGAWAAIGGDFLSSGGLSTTTRVVPIPGPAGPRRFFRVVAEKPL